MDTRPIRILHVIGRMDLGGAETLIICIGGALLGASALSSLFVLGKTKKTPAPDGTENGDTVK